MTTATVTRPAAQRQAPVKPWPPKLLTPVSLADRRRGDGELYTRLINACCRITEESVAGSAGQLMRTRGWQDQLLAHLFARRADGYFKHRTALVGMARKNGKTGLGGGIAIGGMLFGPGGGRIYACAADREQASLVFKVAKRMVEMDPELSSIIKVYRDVLEVPATGTTYKALSAEAFTKEGLNPHLVLFDEVHAQPTRELWDVMQLAMGARVEPMMVGITTAGVRVDRSGQDSLCYGLYEYGKKVIAGEINDPSFFMAWWEPGNVDADHHLIRTWREANPGFDDLVSKADFQAMVNRTPENEFRTKRCNQFVASSKAWLPAGTWDQIAEPTRYPGGIPSGTKVVLAFDGSKNGDSTALLVITVEERPHIQVVNIWERQPEVSNWRIPRVEVKNTIREACRTWQVREVAWDDYMWQDAREELEDERLPIEVYPQTQERMGKATQRFFEGALNELFTHDGHPVLARHIGNAAPKPTNRGLARIAKQAPDSTKWIDGAVAAVFGLDRAEWWHNAHDDGPNIW